MPLKRMVNWQMPNETRTKDGILKLSRDVRQRLCFLVLQIGFGMRDA